MMISVDEIVLPNKPLIKLFLLVRNYVYLLLEECLLEMNYRANLIETKVLFWV